MPECCPCLNFEENPHAELNVYSFLFCFYYMLCSRYPFAFRNIRLFFFFFFLFYPDRREALQSHGRDRGLFSAALFLVYSPQTSSRAIEVSCGELYWIFGSCHVMDISGSAVCL